MQKNNLSTYGFDEYCKAAKINTQGTFARILSVNKTNYKIISDNGIQTAELIGQLLYTLSPSELPQTGDWVEIIEYDQNSIISKVLPRTSVISRKSSGKTSDIQILAANVDAAIIIQGLDQDFNINRIERMSVALTDAGVETIVVLNKIDLDENWPDKVNQVQNRMPNCTVIAITAINNSVEKSFNNILIPQHTYVLMGSSGVGKSTLVNNLLEAKQQPTQEVSTAVGKGKHTTTNREMFILPNGSIFIDSPGVREFALSTENIESVDSTFDNIHELSANCKFKNCTHTSESGCAVLNALKNGTLSQNEYVNYLKLRNEAIFFQQTMQDRKRKGKHLAKLIKDMKDKNMKGSY